MGEVLHNEGDILKTQHPIEFTVRWGELEHRFQIAPGALFSQDRNLHRYAVEFVMDDIRRTVSEWVALHEGLRRCSGRILEWVEQARLEDNC